VRHGLRKGVENRGTALRWQAPEFNECVRAPDRVLQSEAPDLAVTGSKNVVTGRRTGAGYTDLLEHRRPSDG
jgi:hypothetical protein